MCVTTYLNVCFDCLSVCVTLTESHMSVWHARNHDVAATLNTVNILNDRASQYVVLSEPKFGHMYNKLPLLDHVDLNNANRHVWALLLDVHVHVLHKMM